ncbi:hypothetical protein RPHASCH2410_PA01690 (plasmid) [Rhizobium phaseoli Ch24-10]|nr:hypothetical protein RPHASCH2410_PA01690 [Rhizobium phaseoli Ch24-10]
MALDLVKSDLGCSDPLTTLARRSFPGRFDTPIAGIRTRINLVLELIHNRLGNRKMPIKLRLAAERGGPRARPDPHAILRQTVESDEAGIGKRRQMLGQQPVEQIGATNPKIRKRVIVHRDTAAQPAIDVVAPAQPFQSPRAADTVAAGIEPQRQQKPWRNRRMARPVLARFDPTFKRAQIQPLDIAPNDAHRVILADQAVDIDGTQLDLIAHRLAHARRPAPHLSTAPRSLRRQSLEQLVVHHRPPSKSTTQQNHNKIASATKHSQALRRAVRPVLSISSSRGRMARQQSASMQRTPPPMPPSPAIASYSRRR